METENDKNNPMNFSDFNIQINDSYEYDDTPMDEKQYQRYGHERPGLISLIAILQIIAGILIIIASFSTVFIFFFIGVTSIIDIIIGILLFLFILSYGAFFLILGIFVRKGYEWSRKGEMVVYSIGIIMNIIILNPIGLIITVGLLYYFTRPGVKYYFKNYRRIQEEKQKRINEKSDSITKNDTKTQWNEVSGKEKKIKILLILLIMAFLIVALSISAIMFGII